MWLYLSKIFLGNLRKGDRSRVTIKMVFCPKGTALDVNNTSWKGRAKHSVLPWAFWAVFVCLWISSPCRLSKSHFPFRQSPTQIQPPQGKWLNTEHSPSSCALGINSQWKTTNLCWTQRQPEPCQDKAIWETHNFLTLFPTNKQLCS